MNVTIGLDFELKRDWTCGRYYYVEKTARASRCPYCAEDSVGKERAENDRLGRVIRSLRGALTTAKKAKAAR